MIQNAGEASCWGRGLFLVSELASDFGIDHHTVGKTVWAAFKRPAAP
ncbi:ATP-binding protein [Streptomyces bacillaris]